MITLALLVVCAIFSFAAVKSSYYVLKFFAGVAWWALGAWWIYNPIVVGASPANDILLVLVFFGGLAFMFMPAWYTKNENGQEVGRFAVRLPRFLGGRSEAEETSEAERNARTWRDRRDAYRERANMAISGRRLPPRR